MIRGPAPHFIMDRLMQYPLPEYPVGNHDVVWMGAAAGQKACIATVIQKQYPLPKSGYSGGWIRNQYACLWLPLQWKHIRMIPASFCDER